MSFIIWRVFPIKSYTIWLSWTWHINKCKKHPIKRYHGIQNNGGRMERRMIWFFKKKWEKSVFDREERKGVLEMTQVASIIKICLVFQHENVVLNRDSLSQLSLGLARKIMKTKNEFFCSHDGLVVQMTSYIYIISVTWSRARVCVCVYEIGFGQV